jgi:hypothetical protein
MNHAAAGRRREHQVRDHLDAHGYSFVMRAAASKGPADLLHGHPLVGAHLVQVGTGNKTIRCTDKSHPHDRENAMQCGRDRFCEAADLCHATPLLASVIATPGKPTVIRYWRVTRDIPSTWTEWTP